MFLGTTVRRAGIRGKMRKSMFLVERVEPISTTSDGQNGYTVKLRAYEGTRTTRGPH
jgi:hypothetical protein